MYGSTSRTKLVEEVDARVAVSTQNSAALDRPARGSRPIGAADERAEDAA